MVDGPYGERAAGRAPPFDSSGDAMSGIVAIIPARAGSKRIPKKNIIELQGKPLLTWTVEAALDSGKFDAVIVSTDGVDVAEAALAAGAEVPFLRTEAADEMAPSSAATIHTLQQLAATGRHFPTVVQLLPSCPLRTAEDIKSAVEFFFNRDADFVISCVRFGWTNPWWAAALEDDGEPRWIHQEARTRRSQDLPQLYAPSGAIWLAKQESLIRNGTFYGPRHIFWELPWSHALDIDTPEDLDLANTLLRARDMSRDANEN